MGASPSSPWYIRCPPGRGTVSDAIAEGSPVSEVWLQPDTRKPDALLLTHLGSSLAEWKKTLVDSVLLYHATLNLDDPKTTTDCWLFVLPRGTCRRLVLTGPGAHGWTSRNLLRALVWACPWTNPPTTEEKPVASGRPATSGEQQRLTNGTTA